MIAILNAYKTDSQSNGYQDEYGDLIHSYFSGVFPETTIKSFHVGKNQWPKNISDFDLFVISGSPKSVYHDDDWIKKLSHLVQNLHNERKKVIGLCFGHQLIAHALGGEVTQSHKGWGVGVQSFQIFSKQPWMKPEKKNISLLFSHQDQVIAPPLETKILAKNNFCPIQMMQIQNHILSFQGHPEFSIQFAKDRLLTRQHIIEPKTFNTAISSLNNKQDVDTVSMWIKAFALLK